MIRAFITTWTDSGGEVNHPIKSYCDNPPLNPILFIFNESYTDRDANGIPDKPKILVICVADPGETRLEQLANLPGVVMVPAYSFDKLISDIPQVTQDQIKTYLTNNGIPLSVFAGVTRWGQVLRKVANYFGVTQDIQQDLRDRISEWG